MTEKIAIVTGANGGMGSVITKTVALNGYKVIMACKDLIKSKPVYEKIKAETRADIQLVYLDLASFESIQMFVSHIKTQYEHIDLLLNNAGTLCHKPEITSNNIERTVGVNYLGHYILSNMLLPLMGKGTRVVNMVSLTYKYGKINPDLFIPKNEHIFNRFTTYSDSKLAFFYFTMDSAQAWKERGITVNCADPGIVSTNIIRMGNKIIDKLCDIFFRPIIKKPKQGAATLLKLALSPTLEGVTGKCYANKKETKISERILNSPQRELLHELTRQLLIDNNIVLP